MSVPVLPPGATTDYLAASISGTVAPTTSGAKWEIYDVVTTAVMGTDLTPNSWGLTRDGSGGYNITVPASATQGGDPDGNGRYRWRVTALFASGVG